MSRFIRVVFDAESKLTIDGLRDHMAKYVESDELNDFVKYMRCSIRNIGYNLTDDDELCGVEIDMKGPNYTDIDNCIKYIKKNISVAGVKVKRQNFKAKGDVLF